MCLTAQILIKFLCDICQNATLTELQSRLYDKFLVKVTDVKVLIADSGRFIIFSRCN